MQKKTLTTLGVLLLLLFSVGAKAQNETVTMTSSDITSTYKTKTKSRVSVHDPSIVYDNKSQYYIFGTHTGIAKTSDLQSWTGVSSSTLFGKINSRGNTVTATYTDAFNTNQTKTVTALVNGVATTVDFGNFDAEAWACAYNSTSGDAWSLAGNMWAPDIIYNKSMGKWCLYLSLNGLYWNSVIILLTSNNIEGPYVYQGPVVYTGFRNDTDSGINWKQTDLEMVIGEQSSLPSRYNTGNSWGSYWANGIDPCVLYDEEGELWMSYGSWSGGIFMLKLDNETGLRDYTHTYSYSTDNSGRPLSDPYFGTRIAGGYYVSGEGSYIEHIGDYYYLFVTNGGLSAAEGYTMRVFRSSSVTGPYKDAAGNNAIYSSYKMNYGSNDAARTGNLIVGAHNNWGFQTTAEVAQGHNSALLDSDGRAYLVYHTRFNTGNEGFQNRVRQLFTTSNGWLVAAPFEFDGETWSDDSIKSGCQYTKEEICGDYTILRHNYGLDNTKFEVAPISNITLTSDGKVSGDLSGTWSMTEGTSYMTIRIGGITFNSVVVKQTIDGTTLKAIGITGLSQSGSCVWGYKMEPASAIAYTVKNATFPFKSGTNKVSASVDLSLDMTNGCEYEWISSNPDVLSNTGKYNPTDEAESLTMTCVISCGNYQYVVEYDVEAQAKSEVTGDYKSGMVAYYSFDEKPIVNAFDSLQKAVTSKQTNGTLPVLEEDIARYGQVLHVYGGSESDKSCSFAKLTNPLYGQTGIDGFTIAFWVKRADNDLWGTLWSITPKSPAYITSQNHLSYSGNDFLSFVNDADTFAVNYPTTEKSDLSVGAWNHVVITVDSSTFTIYINKLKKYTYTFASTMGNARNFDYSKVLDFVTSCEHFTIGKGGGYGSADAYYDDLMIYNRALPIEDVRSLYAMETRVSEVSTGEFVTGIEDINVDSIENSAAGKSHEGIYDMTGRKIEKISSPGIYIINGKKVLTK